MITTCVAHDRARHGDRLPLTTESNQRAGARLNRKHGQVSAASCFDFHIDFIQETKLRIFVAKYMF